MKKLVKETFGAVSRYELHASIIGKPIMTASCYFIDGTLIDTGQPHARKIVERFIRELEIEQVVLTHYHEDHSGNAAVVKKIKQVPIYGHPLTIQKLHRGFGIRPYQHIMWGKAQKVDLLPMPAVIECGKYVLEPIHTPGHSDDHLSFFEKTQGWLFSGDLFLSPRIRYFRSDENIVATIESLKKVLSLDFEALFCAHNPKPVHGKQMLRLKLDFFENLYGRIRNMLLKGYDQKRIVKYFMKSEVKSIKMMTLGDVSYENMIQSMLRSMGPNAA